MANPATIRRIPAIDSCTVEGLEKLSIKSEPQLIMNRIVYKTTNIPFPHEDERNPNWLAMNLMPISTTIRIRPNILIINTNNDYIQ